MNDPLELTPALYLKLVRNMLEIRNTVRKDTHIFSFRKIPYSARISLIFLKSTFFAKSWNFYAKIVPLLKAMA